MKMIDILRDTVHAFRVKAADCRVVAAQAHVLEVRNRLVPRYAETKSQEAKSADALAHEYEAAALFLEESIEREWPSKPGPGRILRPPTDTLDVDGDNGALEDYEP